MRTKFVLTSIPKGDDMYAFLKEKAHIEHNTLIYPTKEFASENKSKNNTICDHRI